MIKKWLNDFLQANPMLAKKEIHQIGLSYIAFKDNAKIIWCFTQPDIVTVGTDYIGSTDDKYISGEGSSYATARSTSSSGINDTSLVVGQQSTSRNLSTVYRAYLKFDTSAIGSTPVRQAYITQVNLTLTCITDWSTADFDVQIVKHGWNSDTTEQAYDNCLSGTADNSIWRNTGGMASNTPYTSGNLDTSWVNKTGFTYYSLRSKEDYDNSPPATDVPEYVILASQSYATSAYRPILTVISFGFISAYKYPEDSIDILKDIKHSQPPQQATIKTTFFGLKSAKKGQKPIGIKGIPN
jgi:hypothetical protein